MVKTTVELDPVTALALERLASAQGRDQQELIREAIEHYTKIREWPKPKRIGRHHSGHTDTSERVDEILDEAHEKGEWP